MQTIVCLDIETTGLSPDNDSIIEIGAIKFSGTRVIAEYETLINPSRPINQYISNLTGISNAMVMNAPMLSDVQREFVTSSVMRPFLVKTWALISVSSTKSAR